MSLTGCGGTITSETGIIQSPGYPVMNHLNRDCEWIIQVPKGRRVTLEMLDFDLDSTIGLSEQGLAFYNKLFVSNIGYLRGGNTPSIIESSDNELMVFFWSSNPSLHRGFRAKFTSSKPSCK